MRIYTIKYNEWGLFSPPYYPCVSNKMANFQKITIVWHVENLKLSRLYEREVTEVIGELEEIYG